MVKHATLRRVSCRVRGANNTVFLARKFASCERIGKKTSAEAYGKTQSSAKLADQSPLVFGKLGTTRPITTEKKPVENNAKFSQSIKRIYTS